MTRVLCCLRIITISSHASVWASNFSLLKWDDSSKCTYTALDKIKMIHSNVQMTLSKFEKYK